MTGIALRAQAETLAWLRQRHRGPVVVPIVGDSLNSELTLMLGLTPEESDRIDAAVRLTKQRLDGLVENAATGQVSADGRTLTVTVPSLIGKGDALYADLLNTISQVLGPARTQLFNELSGASLDSALDSFGLNPVTYEIALQPGRRPDGVPVFSYRRSFTDATGQGSGWSSGMGSRSDLLTLYPILARFLSVDFGTQAAPPATAAPASGRPPAGP